MLHAYALFSSSFSHRCLSCTCDGIVVVRIRNCARILFSRHFCAACGPVCTCMLIGIRRGFGGGAPIHTSWFGGSAYANASWQPVNGLLPFRVAARQALRKKSYCLLYWFLSYCPTMSSTTTSSV